MQKKKSFYYIALSGAILLLIVSVFILFRSALPHAPEFRMESRRPLTIADVDLIRGWMSFDYLNHSFDIPADYLKTALSITHPRYPNVSIQAVAREKQISIPAYVVIVQRAVREFLLRGNAE